MSGSKKTRTVENRTEQRGVADWLQPYMQSMAPRAQTLLDRGTQIYGGPMVAGFGQETESGLRGLMGYAQQGVPGLQMGYDAATRAMSGYDPGMATMQSLQSETNPLAGLINAGQTTAGIDTLLGLTQEGPNPYLDRTFGRASERVQNQVAAAMARAGMPGSGAHQDLLQQGIGDLATDIYGRAYESDQARRLAAAQALGGFQQSDLARAMQAQGMNADIFSQDLARRLQAAGMSSDAQRAMNAQNMAGIASLEDLYNLGRQPFEDQLRVGGARDELAQRQIDADMARFEQQQMMPWQDLARYQALINPLGQAFGSAQTRGESTQTQSGSPLESIMGGLMMASSLFGNPFGLAGLAGKAVGGAGLATLGGKIASRLGG